MANGQVSCARESAQDTIPLKPNCIAPGCDRVSVSKGLCPRHYQRQRNGQPLVNPPCAHCGGEVSGLWRKKFCSDRCATQWHIKASLKGRWPDGIPASHKEYECRACGKMFKPKRAANAICCSRECGFEWKRIKSRLTKRISKTWFRRKPKPPRQNTCRDCGVPVAKNKQRCEPCRATAFAAARERARLAAIASGARAAARSRRKLKIKGVTVESVNPIKVLERDGWRCQLCGIKTPKRLRGTYNDRAPEVDHIIPLAQGGEHSYRNVQCACRRCNIEKADKPLGQMRLIA